VKAPERPCKGCGATIPAQPSGPGRPRLFCSRACRRDFYLGQERVERERERAEERERRWQVNYGRRAPGRSKPWLRKAGPGDSAFQ
jgi:hypothetical protein